MNYSDMEHQMNEKFKKFILSENELNLVFDKQAQKAWKTYNELASIVESRGEQKDNDKTQKMKKAQTTDPQAVKKVSEFIEENIDELMN